MEEILVTQDVEAFAQRAQTFLASCISRNVLATVLTHARTGAFADGETPTFAYGLDGSGAVCAAALRTPPWPMLIDGFDGEDVDDLADAWLAIDPEVDAVTGPPRAARAMAAALAARSDRASHLRVSEAMHVLEIVSELPYVAPGELRPARAADRELLIEWERAFITEARFGRTEHAERTVDRRLAAASQYVWDDGGPVSTAGTNIPIAGTVRIGPVYTPPDRRGRGYATCAVAALSQRALDAGAERCMLFTDLANPTSNRIYATVGYVRCGEWEEHELLGADVPVND